MSWARCPSNRSRWTYLSCALPACKVLKDIYECYKISRPLKDSQWSGVRSIGWPYVAAADAGGEAGRGIRLCPMQEIYISFELLKMSLWPSWSSLMQSLLQVAVLHSSLRIKMQVQCIFLAIAAFLAKQPFGLHRGIHLIALLVARRRLRHSF